MDQLWQDVQRIREGNVALKQRLETCSKMIAVCQVSNSTKKEKLELIKRVIRISSEIGNFRNNADVISLSAKNFVLKNGRELRSGNISLPREMKKELRHEHLIPCSVLANIFFLENAEENQIYDALLRNGIRAIITTDEDSKIDERNLRSKMPQEWKLGANPFVRYVKSGLNEIVVKPGYFSP
jgi:hypothetical protein